MMLHKRNISSFIFEHFLPTKHRNFIINHWNSSFVPWQSWKAKKMSDRIYCFAKFAIYLGKNVMAIGRFE